MSKVVRKTNRPFLGSTPGLPPGFESTARSRFLTPNLGGVPDTLYYASSGSGLYRLYQPLYTQEGYCVEQYSSGMRNRVTSVGSIPIYRGVEAIESTRFPPPIFNYCLHSKKHLVNKPYGYWADNWNGTSTVYAPFCRMPFNTDFLTVPRITSASIGKYVEDLGFSSRAFWSMRPKFEGHVSLLNTIFELKDFRDLMKNIGKSGAILKDLYRQSRQLSGLKTQVLFSGMKRVEPSRAIAEGYLTKQFAIDPTIKDFLAIAAQCMTSAREAQNKFFQDGIDGKFMHYRENVFVTNNLSTPGAFNNYMWQSGEKSKLVRNATAHMFYTYTKQTTLDAFVHYWGLSGTAEAFWNMLPWSFVMDYILTVGKSLNMMRTDPNVVLDEFRYCESAKYISTAGTHITLEPRLFSFVYDGKFYTGNDKRNSLLVTGIEESVYLRKPKEPYKGPALPRLKSPSNTQMVNLAALVRCLF